MNPSLVSWLTTMMGMRLQVILEHMPVTEDQILQYVRRVGDPSQVTLLDKMAGCHSVGREKKGGVGSRSWLASDWPSQWPWALCSAGGGGG